ncbi:MAG: glycosyltransferase family 39 protein [Bacteroidetes bacterium]|nr:glycosyltransferase family 39 protein [Bacteroidota bacterium]
MISVFSGLFTSYYLYRLGRKYFNNMVGLIAALIIMVSPTHSMYSHFLKTHVPAALLVIIGIGLCLEIINSKDRLINYIKAGLVFGIGTSVIYHVGFSVFCLFTVAIIQSYKQTENVKMFFLNFPYLKLLIGLLMSLLGFFICSPYTILDYNNFILSMTATIAGRFSGGIWEHGITYPIISTIRGLGAPLGYLLIPALIYPFFNWRNKKLWIVCTQPISLLIILMLFKTKEYHHTLIIYPAVALLIGYFVVDISKRIFKIKYKPEKIAFMIIIILSAYPLLKSFQNSFVLSKTDTRTISRIWVLENILSGSKIVMDSGKYYLTTYGPELPMTRDAFIRIINREKRVDNNKSTGGRRSGYKGATKYFQMKMEAQPKGVQYDVYQIIHETAIETIKNNFINSYEEYLNEGIEYAIVNQRMVDNYATDSWLSKNYPEGAKVYRQFYQDLENHGELLQLFKPSDELTGPILKIYKIK